MSGREAAEAAAQRISSSKHAKIVGLDLSLTGTGISVWTVANGKELPGVNSVVTNKLRGMPRIDHIWKAISFEMDCVATGSTIVYIEDFAFGVQQNQSFVREIGMLHGVIRHYLWKASIPIKLVAPTVLKKFVAGSGAAKKEVVILDVYKRFGFEARDNNMADAYSLMAFGRAVEGLWDKELLSFQKETVDKFRSSQNMESEEF